MDIKQTSFATTSNSILQELQRTLAQIDEGEVQEAAALLLHARRVFFQGAGRSGLALKMAAMRMMHLGLTVYVAGEVVTPAIAEGDLLVVASGSGTTSGAVHGAEVAKRVGASVLVLTATPESPLGSLATLVLRISAATKQGDDRTQSQQYAGALFEQAVLLVMDTLFQELWKLRGNTAAELWPRHANLE